MKAERVAFLGPRGTHSELALQNYQKKGEAFPCPTLEAVFEKVAKGEADAGFVPIENLIEGPVTSTLDLLLKFSPQIQIVDSYVANIRNAFGILEETAKKSLDLGKVTKVYSHPQPLRQCSSFLNAKVPTAELTSSPSTSSAAKFVSEKKLLQGAVIAPKLTLEKNGFRVIDEDISDIKGNKTRFVVISLKENALAIDPNASYVTSIVLKPGRDRQGLLVEILDVISAKHGLNLVSIHSRPDLKGGFVFYLEIEADQGEQAVAACLSSLELFCREATGHTARLVNFGTYRRAPFDAPLLHSVGIVGGAGKMGQWFEKFFGEAGLKTYISDLDSGLPLEEVMEKSDVVLLSVPMSSVAELSQSISTLARPGQLIVENCSVKQSSIPHLLEKLPAGVEVLGIHTMFGSQVDTLRDQNVIITETERSGPRAKAFEDLFYKYGARIHRSPVEEHDRVSSFLQALVQFSMISMADVLSKNFNSSLELEPFSTPNSRALLESLERVVNQKGELLLDLQTKNPEAARLRRMFLESVFRYFFLLDQGEHQEFIEEVKKLATHTKTQ